MTDPSLVNANGCVLPDAGGELERLSSMEGRPRVALYSHDTQGLGHIRRNLLITRALCRGGRAPVILLLSGVREAAAFSVPSGVDCFTLPAMAKDVSGRYTPRSLGVSMEELVDVRRRALIAVLRSFQPDALVVDKVPLGAFGELTPSLDMLRARGKTKIILGLRDILDDRATVRREWANEHFEAAVRKFYHRVWIYGDPAVFDTAHEYGMAEDLRSRVRYTGYLNPREVEDPQSGETPSGEVDRGLEGPGDLTLCVVGGGQDGLPLADAFLRAELPAGGHGLLLTGPLMPPEARASLRLLAAKNPNHRMLEFVTDPCPMLQRADRVIAMGGYNTVSEVLAFDKQALIVPRVQPRTEQLIRARRFAELGLVDMLDPRDLDPRRLSAWMAGPDRARPRGVVDFDGVAKLPGLLAEAGTAPRSLEGAMHHAAG